tara:strand:- start:616 stop:924 length:309 start_codon:yes stop_codon:yes gene_type:complete
MIEKIKKNYFIIIGTLLFLYFFLNLLDGERGLISLLKKENLVKNLTMKEKKLKDEIDILEFKNTLLSKNLDKDYVDILLREKFIFGKKNEKIYVLKKNEKSN